MGLLDRDMVQQSQQNQGLLGQIFGNGWDDPKTHAMMAVSAGLLRGDLAGGFMDANRVFAGASERRLKHNLLEAQIAETQAQADERKQNAATRAARTEAINGWLGQLEGAPLAANQAVISQTGSLSPTLSNASLHSQAFGKVTADNPLADIDPRAARADLLLSEGKNIPEWLFKRTTPDMQNINGVWIDKNRAQPGQSIPQMSPTGQGYQLMPDASAPGGFRVATPTGALENYTAFKNVDASIAAQNELVRVFNPGTQREEFVPRSRVLGQQPQQPRPMSAPQRLPTAGQVPAEPGMRGNFVGDPAQVMEAIWQMRDPQERANAIGAFQEQARRTGGFAEGSGFAAGPSAREAADAAAARVRAEAGEKAAAERDAKFATGAANSRDTLNYISEARALFEKGPTASGFGSVVDAGAGLVGLSTPGADAAAQLDTLSGWMVSNVPRMEGPQSNFDVQNYKTMAAMVGDRTKPLSQRKAALDTLERLQQKYAHLNEGAESSPSQGARQTYDTLPKDAQNYRGKVATDTRTGKRYRSNGITWVEEK